MQKNWVLELGKIKKYPKLIKISNQKLLIPSPALIKKIMQKPKKGELLTNKQILEFLEKKYKKKVYAKAVDLFIKLLANSNFSNNPKTKFAFWRIIKNNGFLFNDFPEGYRIQIKKLKNEGHKIFKSIYGPYIKNFESKLIKL
jgi:hypothetical protein